jgi:hypothetical protein
VQSPLHEPPKVPNLTTNDLSQLQSDLQARPVIRLEYNPRTFNTSPSKAKKKVTTPTPAATTEPKPVSKATSARPTAASARPSLTRKPTKESPKKKSDTTPTDIESYEVNALELCKQTNKLLKQQSIKLTDELVRAQTELVIARSKI